ncbi:MAG: hypothetical protein IPO78_14400 [Saprospiraceae bacterium]|nr:hypothetical protein [Saprospiraceae bacterium]
MNQLHFYIINILLCFQLQAQVAQNKMINETPIRILKSGVLLVRLESMENKIQHLIKASLQEDCKSKCKEKIEKQILQLTLDRDAFNTEFIKAFKNNFKFCPVFFYYDKDQIALAQTNYSRIYFLDSTQNNKFVANIPKDSLLILKKDETPNSSNEGWLFQTADGVLLQNGFPYITVNNFKTLMNRLASTDHQKKNCIYLVKKLNKNLHQYLYESDVRKMEIEVDMQ